MPLYNCTTCPNPVDLDPQPTRGHPVDCPTCRTPITHKQRSITSVVTAYNGALNPVKKVKTNHTASAAVGRAPSAPTRTDWPGLNLNSNVTYCLNLASPAWTAAGADKICLAYNVLDINRTGMEGIIIDCPQATGKTEVQGHFAAVKSQLVAAHNNTQICEATGEAAAALCILQKSSINTLTLAGFEMVWGLHVHSGAGLDQIWKRSTTTTKEYLIVEAKGPGASLNTSPMDAPSGFDQMEIRWIMHNLITMSKNSHQVGQDIITDLGLVTATRWPASSNPAQGSKNYYGVTGTSRPPVASLSGVVVTAVWQGDGMLSYSVSGFRQYTNFTY